MLIKWQCQRGWEYKNQLSLPQRRSNQSNPSSPMLCIYIEVLSWFILSFCRSNQPDGITILTNCSDSWRHLLDFSMNWCLLYRVNKPNRNRACQAIWKGLQGTSHFWHIEILLFYANEVGFVDSRPLIFIKIWHTQGLVINVGLKSQRSYTCFFHLFNLLKALHFGLYSSLVIGSSSGSNVVTGDEDAESVGSTGFGGGICSLLRS